MTAIDEDAGPPAGPAPAPGSDAGLLARARAGDRQAFATLYDRHVRPVYWQAYGVLRDDAATEDVTQDVFVTAWRSLHRIRLVDDSVLPWLLVTARFTALNAHRRRARPDRRTEALPEDRAAASAVEDEVVAAHVRAMVRDAVARLSPTDRELYRLCLEEELTYDQAAAELGVSHAAVRNRLHRLRSRLREDLRSVRETP